MPKRFLLKNIIVTCLLLGNERLIGWLAELANHTHQFYNDSDPTSGPTKASKYITALYFTFSSLTSVGFGNVRFAEYSMKIFCSKNLFLSLALIRIVKRVFP
jgi:hypothetical protein